MILTYFRKERWCVGKRDVRLAFGVLLLAMMLTGCRKTDPVQEIQESAAVENLRVIVMGNEPRDGMKELYGALDALTVPELNCRVRFTFVPWGNERKQLNIAVASGEYDIIPGGVFPDYQIQISRNAFLNLKDYLYLVPDLVEHYNCYADGYLERWESDGGLYGIPQFGAEELQYDNEGFFYREDLRLRWGCPEIDSLETMEQYLYAAKEDPQFQDEALITDNRIWQSLWILLAGDRYWEVSSMQETPFVVVPADDPSVVLNRLETPEFQEVLEYLKKWKQDGILEADMLALSDNEGERGLELMLAERKPCETNVPIWSVSASYIQSLATAHPEWTYGFFLYLSANQNFYRNETAVGSALYVSSRTKYPETAVRLLEKIHTDQRYYDLFLYGVDGIHYHNIDGAVSYEGISPANKYGMTVANDSLLGRRYLEADDRWEEVREQIDVWREEAAARAKRNPLDDYEFAAGGLERELHRLETARLQGFQPLVCGYYSGPKDLEDAVRQLEEAGLVNYMEEIERQLTVYYGSREKDDRSMR